MNLVHSGPIPLEFNHSGAIPVESGHSCGFRCHSSAIPAELPDSGWNLWGTVKYCVIGTRCPRFLQCRQ